MKDGSHYVRVGAGCTLQGLLDTLHAATDHTLPTLGAVTKQTIAGAISTGTHGLGLQSLSHFVANVRMGTYDSAGRAVDLRIPERRRTESRSVRTGLHGDCSFRRSSHRAQIPGCGNGPNPRHRARHSPVYLQHPLTQFVYTPYSWKWVAFERKAVGASPPTPLQPSLHHGVPHLPSGWPGHPVSPRHPGESSRRFPSDHTLSLARASAAH